MNTLLRSLKYGLALLGVAFTLFLALGARMFFHAGSSEDYSAKRAREGVSGIFSRYGVTLSASDRVEQGWQDHHWLDSQKYYLARTSPERVAALKKALLEAHGREESGWRTEVQHVPSDRFRRQPHDPSAKRPGWWKPDSLKEAESIGVTFRRKEGGSYGHSFILSVPDGVVLVTTWST